MHFEPSVTCALSGCRCAGGRCSSERGQKEIPHRLYEGRGGGGGGGHSPHRKPALQTGWSAFPFLCSFKTLLKAAGALNFILGLRLEILRSFQCLVLISAIEKSRYIATHLCQLKFYQMCLHFCNCSMIHWGKHVDRVRDWIKCSICPSSSTNKFSITNKTSNGVLIKFVAPGSTPEPSNSFCVSICCEMFQEVCSQCIMSMTSTGFIWVTRGPGGNMWPRRLVVFTCKGLLPPSESGSRLWMPRALGAPAPAEWNNRVKKKNSEEGGKRGGERESNDRG